MAKIRGIKPDFWTDEDIVELSMPARLLFIGMWNHACDNGHLDDKPKQLKMRVLPADDVDVEALLGEMVKQGRIVRAGGVITVLNFARHQKPDRRFLTFCDHCAHDENSTYTPGDKAPRSKGARGAHDVHPPNDPDNSPPPPDVHPEGARGVHTDEGDGEGEGEGDGDQVRVRDLTIADPPPARPEITRICEYLADHIEANTGKRPNIGARWHDAARLLLDRDNRTEAQVLAAIDWCQHDEFWRGNILSLPKLREKYDQLRLHAQRSRAATTSQQRTDDLFDRAAQRMGIA